MIDRESVFADPEVTKLLHDAYIPVALDVWYHERRQDEDGEFYREVVHQRKGMRPGRTTQGFYIFTAGGSLLHGWNNRDAKKVARRLKETLPRAKSKPAKAKGTLSPADSRFDRRPPEGGAVVEVYSKILEGRYSEKADRRWQDIMRRSTGRDHLWITGREIEQLARGRIPDAIVRRIARYHCIDNTRGEPPMWRPAEVKEASLVTVKSKGKRAVKGTFHVETATRSRGYEATAFGHIATKGTKLTRFDLLVVGDYWGHGRYTQNPPDGRFKLAIAFKLSERKTPADEVPPQGSRDLRAYLNP